MYEISFDNARLRLGLAFMLRSIGSIGMNDSQMLVAGPYCDSIFIRMGGSSLLQCSGADG
jgi:hypothetical protein